MSTELSTIRTVTQRVTGTVTARVVAGGVGPTGEPR